MSARRRVLPDALRRGWCPGLSRPMPTGDGLLARLHPPLGRLSVAQVRAIGQAARRFGNGHVDVTARANLQIRGVTEATTAALAAFLDDHGLGDVRRDGGPQRLTLTSPLAGLDPDEPPGTLALAEAIETAGHAIPGLPAKTLVVLDGPGVAEAGGDITLSPRPGHVAIALADDPPFAVAPEAAAETVATLLRAFAGTGRRRMRDLAPAERDALRSGLPALGPVQAGEPHLAPPLPCGLTRVGAHRIVTVAAPFGRCEADRLDRLAEAAEALGGDAVRTTPDRGFLLVGEDEAASRRALDHLAEAGFVTRGDDPRRAVAACPGAPACASGSTPVPDHAARLAQAFAPFAARGLTAHVSGCAKGCARPGPADLTLVADRGRYRVALVGDAGAALGSRLTFETALERVRRAEPSLPLGRAFEDVTP